MRANRGGPLILLYIPASWYHGIMRGYRGSPDIVVPIYSSPRRVAQARARTCAGSPCFSFFFSFSPSSHSFVCLSVCLCVCDETLGRDGLGWACFLFFCCCCCSSTSPPSTSCFTALTPSLHLWGWPGLFLAPSSCAACLACLIGRVGSNSLHCPARHSQSHSRSIRFSDRSHRLPSPRLLSLSPPLSL